MIKIALMCCLAASAYAAGIPRHQPLTPAQARIIGGGPADLGEYPSQLSLQFYDTHFCGAVVLNEKYALTAAHCVERFNTSSLNFRSGSLEVNGGTKHQAVRFILNEGYDPANSFNNDIAIVEVLEPFVLGPNVQPVQLPNQDDETAAGVKGTVIGWGLTSDGGSISEVLKEVETEFQDQTDCENLYGAEGINIYPGQICTNDPEGVTGTCNLDGGGPIFVDGIVVGLVSWGRGGCISEFPLVSARVAFYRDWIFTHSGV